MIYNLHNGEPMKKYELQPTDKTTLFGKRLFRVVALCDFGDVRKGDLGGYIENTDNLSHEGNCWVFGDARVFGKARVFDNARVSGDAWVYDNARVFGDALVFGDVEIYDTTELTGGYALDTKDNGNGAQSASEKPKTCHGEQTGKFCSECGEKL